MGDARDEARALWGRHPAGTTLVSAERGTAEFFEQMRLARYREQPWHPGILAGLRGGRLLEIGCGAGTDLAMLAAGFDDVVGIDLAETGVRLAKSAVEHFGGNGRTLVADGERLPFKDGSFDAVYSFGVLHHTDHPEAVVANIRRVLRPGGRVMIGLYHRWSAFAMWKVAEYILKGIFGREHWREHIARIEGGAEEEGLVPKVRLYSRREARRLLVGFRDVRIRVVHLGFHGWMPESLRGITDRRFGWYVIVEGVR